MIHINIIQTGFRRQSEDLFESVSLCLNLMLEPTYLTYFCGMKKETHMYSLRPIIIEIIKK